MNKLLLILTLICIQACTPQTPKAPAGASSDNNNNSTAPNTTAPPAQLGADDNAQPNQKEIEKSNVVADTLAQELSYSIPTMADFNDNEMSTGAVDLVLWASYLMTWKELQEVPTTKYGLVMKDSEAQRGKKMCISGQVIEIAADKSLPKTIYVGGLIDQEYKIYRYVAVGSSGEIVSGSRARFCGIVTGRNDYSNSTGGVAHAVHLVGMFDIPDNNKNQSSKHRVENNTTSSDDTTGDGSVVE